MTVFHVTFEHEKVEYSVSHGIRSEIFYIFKPESDSEVAILFFQLLFLLPLCFSVSGESN